MSFTHNPYKRLIGLLPATPLQVGDVTAVSGGVATVQMPGGGYLTARGDATIGQRVFVRDNVIEGPAPNLTFVTVEV